MLTLADLARSVLLTANPAKKAALTHDLAVIWNNDPEFSVGIAHAPRRPRRPNLPELKPPAEMPKRGRGNSHKNKAALLHALAHIELNAIDLSCDLISRFANPLFPREFYDDWVRIANEEATHFVLLTERLAQLGTVYGDLPAHDGLWEAAESTRDDLLLRLAIVPLVLEARGLDVAPAIMNSLKKVADKKTLLILDRIYTDEIDHVSIGWKWFTYLCQRRELDPKTHWYHLVKEYFPGKLKKPFNHEARTLAGFRDKVYERLCAT